MTHGTPGRRDEARHRRAPVVAPRTIDEAVAALAERPELRLVHGGTDLMVGVNAGTETVEGWISLRRLPALARVEAAVEPGAGSPTIRIGAGATFASLQDRLAHAAPALAAAARTVGSPQIRHAGTVGGNLATASPAADSVPPLLCYDAVVELASTTGTRRIPLAEFAVGPKRTVRRPDELLTGIDVTTGGVDTFAKVGTRNAMVISVCSLAARIDPELGLARLAIGSVAPTVRRVPEAEEALLDRTAGADVAAAVVAAADPIDDVRASAAYRRHAIGVLAARAHARLWRLHDRRSSTRSVR